MAERFIVKRECVAEELEVEGRVPAIMAAVAYSFTDRKLPIKVICTSSEHPEYPILRIMPGGSTIKAVDGSYYLLDRAIISGNPWAVDLYHELLEEAKK